MLRRTLLVAALLVPLSVIAVPTPASAASGLTATFSAANNGSCFLDKLIVANPTTTAITGWTLEFDLPTGVTMGGFYNGTATQNGSHVTVVNAHYNGTVAAGANTEPYSPWFIAFGSGAAPLNCRINGNKCDGSADRPPNAPHGLSVTGRTTRTVSLSWTAAAATAPVNGTTLNPADDTTPPSVPGNLRGTGRTASTVSLAWNASSDVHGIAGYDAQDPYPFEFSVNLAIASYLDSGVNPRQLTFGFPFYGRGWQGVTAGGVNGEWQSANGAAPGQFQEEAGTRGYANLLAMVPNCTVFHDLQSISTYCFTGNGGQWWSFDDTWSIQQKTSWLKSKGLLGAMVWEMSGDTTSGTLMTALHNGLSS